MLLFYGSGSEQLTKQLAEKVTIPLAKVDFVRFGDSELKPRLLSDVRGQDCIIIASTSNPVNERYMEFFLLVDALRRSACGRITAIMPYFGYARQNQQHLPGEPVSAMLMAKFIETVGVDEFVSIDLHEEQITGFFTIPVVHLSVTPILSRAVGEEILRNSSQSDHTAQGRIIVISPDQGGVERTRRFRDALAEALTRHPEGGTTEGSIQIDSSATPQNDKIFVVDAEIGIVEKLRNLEGIHETKMVEISGNIAGKIVVVPDDVIVSGGTIIHAAEAAKAKGAKEVYVAATHADFIEGTVDKLQNSPVEKVFVADTIEIKDEWKFDRLEVVSVSSVLVDHIRKLL